MIDVNSWWLIFPNPLGIHNAGCSYASSLNIVIVVLFALLALLIRLKGIISNQFYIIYVYGYGYVYVYTSYLLMCI